MTHERWRAALSVASRLGVSPPVFWRLSVREWLAVTAEISAHAPLRREDFEALARRYPDH